MVDDTQAIDLSSAEQVTTAHFTYLGCYKDSRDRGRDVVGGYYGYGHTAETCSLKAKEMKHKYFAVQNGGECHTGTSYGKYGKANDNECNMKCGKGTTKYKCGAGWRNAVF